MPDTGLTPLSYFWNNGSQARDLREWGFELLIVRREAREFFWTCTDGTLMFKGVGPERSRQKCLTMAYEEVTKARKENAHP